MKRLNSEPTIEEAALWEKEFLSGNDRATVIVAAARLDAMLGEILEKYFLPCRTTKGEEDQLLSRMRPLSSFSARIYIARRLGLINEPFEDALHVVRELRNAMAHEPFTKISLDESPHKEQVRKLYACFKENDIVTFTWETMGKERPDNYSGQCRIMMMMLLWALTKVKASGARPDAKGAMTLRITRYKRVKELSQPPAPRLNT
jgi:hypothetical protein